MRSKLGGGIDRFASLRQTFVMGDGALDDVPREATAAGWQRVALVSSPTASSGFAFTHLSELLGDRVMWRRTDVRQHAPIAATEAYAADLRQDPPDVLVAVGGGSASDTAKGIAILLAEGGRLEDHCSTFTPPDNFAHRELERPKLPVVSVPTTLSGAEVTPGGGATNAAGIKRVFWDPKVAAALVCLDPRSMSDTPTQVLLDTGMNSLAHCAEGLYSRSGSMLASALAKEASEIIARNMLHLSDGNRDPAVLQGLQTGSALSGLVISNARVGLHHAICHVLGGHFGVQHGTANAVMLPYVLDFNLSETATAQEEFATALIRASDGTIQGDSPPQVVARFAEAVGTPRRLRDVGVRSDDLSQIAAEVMQDRGLYFNPKEVLDEADVLRVLEAAW